MKLFWKIFYSMVLMTVIFCSLGGHFLIYRQFESSIEKEVESIFEENDFLCHMIIQEKKAHPLESVEILAKDIRLSVGQRKLYFRISDSFGNEKGANGILPVDSLPLVVTLSKEEQGWELLKQENGKIYLHGAAAMLLDGETLYLENCKEVTSIYEERQNQFRSFYQMMILFVCMIGILSFGIAGFLLKPIRILSETTRIIAEGNLEKRSPIETEDELGQLSKDFNRMADSLEQKIEELKAAALRQEEFMGSFAHEMKTPLTSIIGYADLLRSMELKPEKIRENADYIFKEGRRLENLSKRMMDLIVLGKEELERKSVPAKTFFERVENEIRPILEKEGICLLVKWEATRLFIEEDLMITVCFNLLDNGRKAVKEKMQTKSAETQIEQRYYEQPEDIVEKGNIELRGCCIQNGYSITVADNGRGIPQEELKRVKEAFYMVDKSRARAMGGAGLGLSICDKIVRLHGGEMRIESIPRKGTSVTIVLKGGELDEQNEKI